MSLISAHSLSRTVGSGRLEFTVIQDISLTIETGEFVGIMGKSGAGKSTLLYQLSLLDRPTTGELHIADIDVAALTETERTAFRLNTLGYVFQDYALVPELSAAENVMLPLLMRGHEWAAAQSAAAAALTSVGLAGKDSNLPGELSGGEKQRVAIARATVGTPQILFADEPTANLDSTSGGLVIDLLTELNHTHNQTIVMVTHEREYAHNCDRILHMEDGQIVAAEPE